MDEPKSMALSGCWKLCPGGVNDFWGFPQLAARNNILMLAHKVSGQGFPDNTDIPECFNSHAAEEDPEELTALSNQM
jgi:hypothetical protein